jgi:hypothetical protein
MKTLTFFLSIFCISALFAQTSYVESFDKNLPEEWRFEQCAINNTFFSEGGGSLEFLQNGSTAISPKFGSASILTFELLATQTKDGSKLELDNETGHLLDHNCSLSVFVLENNELEKDKPVKEILVAKVFKSDWTLFKIDLSVYQNFQIKFVFNCDDIETKHSFYLDAFTLEQFSPLPVELVEFKANKNRLSFVTASEKDNAYFIIERSADAKNFKEIGRLKGGGTTASHRIYQFIDQEQLVGANYYRLKQVDKDERFEYSKIIVSYLNKKAIKANVISTDNNSIKLRIISDENTDANVSIVDMNGKIILTAKILLDNNVETDFLLGQNLQAGMYAVQIVTEGNQLTSKLFYIN